MKPSKKEDFPLMWVWDDSIFIEENRVKRNVSWVKPGGGCYSVDSLGNRTYWSNCAEIKKTRLMTSDEMIIKACEPWGYAVRYLDAGWRAPSRFVYTEDADNYEWCDTSSGTFGEPQKFEV